MTGELDSAPDDPYRVVGERYRLAAEIGRGAMGTVWAGTDTVLNRPVAVKELKLAPGLPEGEAAELRERALREARAMAVVAHPNVVTVYDVAWADDTPLVVMELVDGQSLATILDRFGPLDHEPLAFVVDRVAAALQAAHRVGIVHRDVKPGNVLVGRDGEIKLGDFGIARNSADPTLTGSGYLMGTPAYLAPEVASGEPVTASADLWSLGAMLFLAAEGRRPYDNNDPLVVLGAIVHGEVPQHHQTGPIGQVISGLMVKAPASRMPLAEVRRHIRPLLPEEGTNPLHGLPASNTTTGRAGSPDTASGTSGVGHTARTLPPQDSRRNGSPRVPPESRTGSSTMPRRWVIAMSVGVVVLLGALVAFVGYSNSFGGTGEQVQEPARGVPPESLDAYSLIQGEDFARGYPGGTVETHTTKDVVNGSDIEYVELGPGFGLKVLYRNVDFGAVPPRSLMLNTQTSSDPNLTVEFRLDDPETRPIGVIPIGDSGEPGWWLAVSESVSPVTGTHDVWLTLAPEDGNPYGPVHSHDRVYVDWFRFEL
ncbi:protein kinase [Nocardia flavorosea]|uniref:protein kinase domain-containing protein n=1 Tax=Nocardia flavorosea TaxID=53429 RepID=UPI0018962435|nr:protein kinase [Nocardia flavorosea]MBF6352895.1 protein kinase [Nocardia flavorosea]